MQGTVAIRELGDGQLVDLVAAVARKRRLRTRQGASYLALELVDPSGRIEARIWNDIELLDARFGEGDAVRVLGRVETFRGLLQLDVRTLEPSDVDPGTLVPTARRDLAELDGFLEFLAAEIAHPGLASVVAGLFADERVRERLRTLPASLDGHHGYAGGLLEHTVAVASLCREAAQLHSRLREDILLAAALLHDVGRTLELEPGPVPVQTLDGRLLGHVHLGLGLIEEHAGALVAPVRAELLHAVATHHDARAARTAEAAALYHANQLDAAAATLPVDTG